MLLVKNFVWVLFWTLIIGLSLYFFFDNVVAFLFGYRSRNFGNSFFNNQVWVMLHLVGGTMCLLTGPAQFWPSLRKRFLSFHRATGKVYMAGVLLIGLSSLRLSLVSYCVPCRLSLFILTILVLLSTALAWKTIRNHNIKAHRQFMVRSYICVLAFVAVRIDDVFPLNFLFGTIEDQTFNRTVNEYFFSFVPLIVGEIFLTWLPATRFKKKTIA